MMGRLARFVLAAVLVAASAARAESTIEPPPGDPSPAASRWYGWQMILVDAAAVGMMAAAAKIGDGTPALTLGIAGATAFALGGPLVHLAHGSPGKAGISFLVRTVPAGLGLGIAVLAADTRRADVISTGALVALLAGGAGSAAGMFYDWGVLSREPAPRVALGPILGPRGRGSGLALVLRF